MRARLIGDDAKFCGRLAGELSASAIDVVTQGLQKSLTTGVAETPAPSCDVTLIDFTSAPHASAELIPRLLRSSPGVPIVAVHAALDVLALRDSVRAGAAGVSCKTDPLSALVASLHFAVAGGAPFSRSFVKVFFVSAPASPLPPSNVQILTKRELSLLELLCLGATYREAGAMLRIGQGTVQTYVKSLYRKLGASNKAEALRFALESGAFAWNSSRVANGTWPLLEGGAHQ